MQDRKQKQKIGLKNGGSEMGKKKKKSKCPEWKK